MAFKCKRRSVIKHIALQRCFGFGSGKQLAPVDNVTTFLVHGEQDIKIVLVDVPFIRCLFKRFHTVVYFALRSRSGCR